LRRRRDLLLRGDPRPAAARLRLGRRDRADLPLALRQGHALQRAQHAPSQHPLRLPWKRRRELRRPPRVAAPLPAHAGIDLALHAVPQEALPALEPELRDGALRARWRGRALLRVLLQGPRAAGRRVRRRLRVHRAGRTRGPARGVVGDDGLGHGHPALSRQLHLLRALPPLPIYARHELRARAHADRGRGVAALDAQRDGHPRPRGRARARDPGHARARHALGGRAPRALPLVAHRGATHRADRAGDGGPGCRARCARRRRRRPIRHRHLAVSAPDGPDDGALRGELFDGVTARATPVTVVLSATGELRIRGATTDRRVALAECRLTPAIGRTPRLIGLPDGASIETRDLELLAAWEVWWGRSKGARFVHGLESRWRYALVAAAVMIVAAVAAYRWGIPLAARTIAFGLPA